MNQLARAANLALAWRRITTGGNHSYKRQFRDLYVAYEIALGKNLDDLRQRLLGGTFSPQKPERVYLPKSSGLHRPLSLLFLEDQIVLQAFANLAATKVHAKRAPLQMNAVFSNILEDSASIFFFRRWQTTYAAFKRKIRKNFRAGYRWVADFDLAAFYDTISHELLLKTIYPRTPTNGDMAWLRDCLATWTSDTTSERHGHGIPQGPLASDFLAECFLLPIDLKLNGLPGYARYVDDVRLFGRTEDEVRLMVIRLERLCRERGLIPQTGKFAIKRATSVEDALGMLPSIADPQRSADDASPRLSRPEARSVFRSALGGKPRRVLDKTRMRYVLYRAEPDSEILRLVVGLAPHHPEHADAFFSYLREFGPRVPVARLCLSLIASHPYAYVRGEAWALLAQYVGQPRYLAASTRQDLTQQAVRVAKERGGDFSEKAGACTFLVAIESSGFGHLGRFLRFQPRLLQAFLGPYLPDGSFAPGEAGEQFLRASAFEPGLSICGRLHSLSLSPPNLGIATASLPTQVRNTLAELGVIAPASMAVVDAISEVIERRYGVPPAGKSWHTLLQKEYMHALGVLKQAEAAFDVAMSTWLANMNSFHHAVFLALQRHLSATAHPGACKTVSKDGKLVDFGVMLDAGGPFSRACPRLADCFRAMNTRRNHLPLSHPYDKKSKRRSKHLTTKERKKLVADLKLGYADLMVLMP